MDDQVSDWVSDKLDLTIEVTHSQDMSSLEDMADFFFFFLLWRIFV